MPMALFSKRNDFVSQINDKRTEIPNKICRKVHSDISVMADAASV